MIESIKASFDRLDELTVPELQALQASATTAFDVANVAGADESLLTDYLKVAKSARGRIETIQASAGASTNEPPADEPASEPEATTASADEPEATTASTTTEEPPSAPADTPADPEPEAVSASAEEGSSTTTSEETAVTASTDTLEVPPDNQPVIADTPAPVTVTAGADVQGFSAGTVFKDRNQVGEAMLRKIRAVRGTRSAGQSEKLTVATITASYPEDRTLDSDVLGNETKINNVLNGEAVVASGGYCAPLPVRYDIYGLGVTSRPVRDSLVMFGANRGGLRFVSPPKLGDLSNAVGLWTADNDANPGYDGPETKAKLKVQCAAEVDAEADAVTLQLEFGNFMTRAFPELVNRNNELALIEHARFAELTLLSKMKALSTEVTAAAKLGVGRDFLKSIGQGAAAYRSRHRMDRTTPLRVLAPNWVLDAMREDLAQGLPGDTGLAYADAQISNFLMARNVRVTWHLDGTFSAQTGSAPLVEFPSTFEWFLFSEGTFLFLDGGTLDLGVVRDSELVGTNDYITFTETFEGIANIGVEALNVTQASLIEGAVIGTLEPSTQGS